MRFPMAGDKGDHGNWAFGLHGRVNPVPFVTSGKLAVETNAEEAVAVMLAHTTAKREALGI